MAFANHRCLYIVLSWILYSPERGYSIKHLNYHCHGIELITVIIEHRCNFGLNFTSACCLGYICGLFYRVFCLTILKTHFKALLTRLIAFCVYWPMFDNKIDCRPVSGHLNGISLSLFEIHSRLVLFLLSWHLNRGYVPEHGITHEQKFLIHYPTQLFWICFGLLGTSTTFVWVWA